MRDHLEAFIAGGGNVAFFSGNPAAAGPHRGQRAGPDLLETELQHRPGLQTDDRRTLSTLWSSHLVKRPENSLTGVRVPVGRYHLSHGQFMDGKEPSRSTGPKHWIFAGTNLKRDEEFGAKHTIVGYECDGCELTWKDGLPSPTHKDGNPETFEVLATCPAKWEAGDCEWYDQWERGRVGNACLGSIHTRRHGLHLRLDRLGPRSAWRGRSDRADHEEHHRAPGAVGIPSSGWRIAESCLLIACPQQVA